MQQTALVIEDNLSLAQAINTKLQLSGFNTVTARSVESALALMKDEQPIRVIWLDHYLLGDKDGIDFAEAVRANNAWKGIPIYVVSNTASNDKMSSYTKLGINRYYVKAEHRLEDIIADIKADIGTE